MGGAGNDTFRFSGLVPATGISINGGGGNNTLTGPAAGASWTITGTNAGTIGTTVSFQKIENLTGGAGNDTFQFIGNAFVTGTLNGGGGSNTLDYSNADYATTSAIHFTNFSSTAGLALNGAATTTTSDGTVLRLVKNISTPQAKSAFSNQQVSDSTFSTNFQFRLTDKGGLADTTGHVGADGFVFVLQNGSPSDAVNTGLGQAIGYGGNFPDSIGIAFDTWDDASPHFLDNDSSSNELGIDLNGSVDHGPTNGATKNVSPDFDDGKLWNVWITYDGTTLNIYASESSTQPANPTLSQKLNLPRIIGSPFAYAGFTAGTYAGWENEDILNWQFSSSTSLPNNPGVLVDFHTPSTPTTNATGIGEGFSKITNVIGTPAPTTFEATAPGASPGRTRARTTASRSLPSGTSRATPRPRPSRSNPAAASRAASTAAAVAVATGLTIPPMEQRFRSI